jgi:REP element-mobilizing transposase RayT
VTPTSARDRRSIRLADYDYAQTGAYFITIGVHDRACLFGEIHDGIMALNELGSIVHAEWDRSTEVRAEIALDAFVVMPNHVHGVVIIDGDVGATGRSPVVGSPTPSAGPRGPSKRSLGAFVGGFKSGTTSAINRLRGTPGAPVWQRNYYEHVIRNEEELNRIRRYIAANPIAWPDDDDNPAVRSGNRTGRPAGRPYYLIPET